MGISDLIRRRAAVEGLHPRWADAYPSLERNGLARVVSDSDPVVHLDTGHALTVSASDAHPDWHMGVWHSGDLDDFLMPRRKLVVNLGPGDHDVGDRAIRALRHPQVMESMREQMTPAAPGEWWHREVVVR